MTDLDFNQIFQLATQSAQDGVYDEIEELEKWAEHKAEMEHEYWSRSAEEKRTEGWSDMVGNWAENHSVGAGIMLYLDGGEWL